jgi:murein DD-endopeptidase MepM/ murein hydrolase activator NlpD
MPRLVLLMLLFLAQAVAAGAYRYKDEQGNWVYTDRPPNTDMASPVAIVPPPIASPHMSVEAHGEAGNIVMVAVNECSCPVEFAIKVQAPDGEHSARKVISPRARGTLIEVKTPPGDAQIGYEYGYVIGDPAAVHNPSQPYRVPFAVAQSFPVSQAPPDAVTHVDAGSRNAIDIAMPVGTGVHAARDGVVINVAHKYFRSGLDKDRRDEANFVQILHEDGTNALYAHLQMDTVRVRPGQRVLRGEYIANSGNTGYSSGPHLHFVVLRNAGMKSESVPVSFEGPGGASLTPHSGQMLTAY